MRGPQLSCTAVTRDDMVVRTDTQEVVTMRQEVMAIILANHSDRCLTCHRGSIAAPATSACATTWVTHRCVTLFQELPAVSCKPCRTWRIWARQH